MTKTLTEQWRDGTLPNGDYYIKVRGRLTKKDFYAYDNCINGKWAYTLDGNIVDIIEKVPSYEKYNELVQKMHILNEQNTKQYNEFCEEIKKNNILEKKLKIAIKALEEYANCKPTEWMSCVIADKALKEMEGVR